MFRRVPLSIIRNFSLYTQQNLYDIYHWYVYSEKSPDDGRRNFPKHVDFCSKNKFEKLVHLVGFKTRIILQCCFVCVCVCVCVYQVTVQRCVLTVRIKLLSNAVYVLCVSSYCPTLCTYCAYQVTVQRCVLTVRIKLLSNAVYLLCVSSYCPTLCTYLYILTFTWKVWCKQLCVGEGTRNVVLCAWHNRHRQTALFFVLWCCLPWWWWWWPPVNLSEFSLTL